ncbi:MAG: NUDIX domain-containing protein [Variovorax sp.]
MSVADPKFCPVCATPLASIEQIEDSGPKTRLRCPACSYTHWNNPVPVLAAIVEYHGQVLLARNAAWPPTMFALITGFMEAGETPEGGIAREVKEETSLDVTSSTLVGVYDFQRMNQIIIAYHVVAEGEIKLSAELLDYRLHDLQDLKCWPAGTGYALADWLRSRGHEPVFFTAAEADARRRGLDAPASASDQDSTHENRS